MAKDIQMPYASGKTLYGVVLNSSGQAWNGTSFETIATGDWTSYAAALTEASSSGIYQAAFPSGISTAGLYTAIFYQQLGGSAADSDLVVGCGEIQWSGSAEVTLATLLAGLGGVTVSGYSSGQDPVSLLLANDRFRALLAYVDCKYTYNAATGTLVLYDTNGTTVLVTCSLTFDSYGNISVRTVSGIG